MIYALDMFLKSMGKGRKLFGMCAVSHTTSLDGWFVSWHITNNQQASLDHKHVTPTYGSEQKGVIRNGIPNDQHCIVLTQNLVFL